MEHFSIAKFQTYQSYNLYLSHPCASRINIQVIVYDSSKKVCAVSQYR